MSPTNNEPTPTPEAVAHALYEEVTQAHATRPPSHPASLWSLRGLSIVLGTVLALGALIGTLAEGFYVKRSEYTASEAGNAVAHTKITETLDRVDRTLQAQTQAMTKMSEALQAQAIEMASLKHSR